MRRLAAVLVYAFALSACGGGGGGSTLPLAAPLPGSANSGNSPDVSVPQHYAIVDLGAQVYPLAINNRNTVVGAFGGGAFRYRNGTLQTLHAPGGGPALNATDVNDRDVVVGTNGYAIEWQPDGSALDLGAPPVSFVQTVAIGNDGEILGISPLSGIAGCGGALTLFAANAAPKSVGPDSISIGGINASGVAAIGEYEQSGAACMGSMSPALYPAFTAVAVPPDFNLDTFTGIVAVTDINNTGSVIGYGPTTTPQGTGPIATFLSRGGNAIEIDPPGGYDTLLGFGMNDLGWIVGTLQLQSTQVIPHAFVWNGGRVTDLNALVPANCNWVLNAAQDVNNAGDIIGTGTFDGKTHGFLLVPQH